MNKRIRIVDKDGNTAGTFITDGPITNDGLSDKLAQQASEMVMKKCYPHIFGDSTYMKPSSLHDETEIETEIDETTIQPKKDKHYDGAIDPTRFLEANPQLTWCQSNIIKYAFRLLMKHDDISLDSRKIVEYTYRQYAERNVSQNKPVMNRQDWLESIGFGK